MADNPKSLDICVLCKKPLVEGEMVFRERGGDLVKHQVCPPKSLASLADELELQTIVVSLEMTQAEVRRTKEAMMAAAAALRAPTIAADDALLDNPTAFNTINFRNELQPFLNDWLAKANRESQKHGFAESFRYDSNDRCLLDHILIVLFDRIRKALATPPTEESNRE